MEALPANAGGAGLGVVAMFNQKSRSPGKFVVMRQIQGQARKLNGMSGSGPVMVTRVRHSPVITGQFHCDEIESRSSSEVGPQVWIQISGVHGQAEVWRWRSWRQA